MMYADVVGGNGGWPARLKVVIGVWNRGDGLKQVGGVPTQAQTKPVPCG